MKRIRGGVGGEAGRREVRERGWKKRREGKLWSKWKERTYPIKKNKKSARTHIKS